MTAHYPSSQAAPPLRGYCHRCRMEHVLPSGNAVSHCVALMSRLEGEGCLDFDATDRDRSGCRTDFLFGKARGKMFGILEGVDCNGNVVVLRAYSGQYNGRWHIPGWVKPLFPIEKWHRVNDPVEKQIKALTAAMAAGETAAAGDIAEHLEEIKRRRRALSRELMEKLHSLYRVANFRGEEKSLSTFYANSPGRGVPTGAGDCCGPKLLNHAILHGITPTGMAEFYWGRENRLQDKNHSRFYPPCNDKCGPLLGFMLCGCAELQSASGRPR